jgi:uncharacterized damage-inducible protein DinB
MPTRKFPDLFVDPEDDPREGGTRLGDERATLVESLRCQRLTLELKCAGLGAEALARRSVEPSTMSLLGLVRHMADVERTWFRQVLSGQDAPRHFRTADDRDADFNGVAPDPDMVSQAWELWHSEIAFAERFVADASDLDIQGHHGHHGAISLREILVHMLEEYARHNGHADLLREALDGETGE